MQDKMVIDKIPARPRHFSNERLIAGSEAENDNFWSWFEGSVMVDAVGRPIAYYHGTTTDTNKMPFEEFDNKKSKWCGMHFFSDDYHWVQSFITEKSASMETGEYIFTTALRITKPFDCKNSEHVAILGECLPDHVPVLNYYLGDVGTVIPKEDFLNLLSGSQAWLCLENDVVINALKSLGFDGLLSTEFSTTVAVFDASQIYIKSTGMSADMGNKSEINAHDLINRSLSFKVDDDDPVFGM